MKLIQYEKNNKAVVTGEIENVESIVTSSGEINTLVTIKGTEIDPELQMETEASITVRFTDKFKAWSEIFEKMEENAPLAGTPVSMLVNLTENSNNNNADNADNAKNITYWGIALNKISKVAHVYNIKSTDDKGNEVVNSVLIGRLAKFSEVKYDEEKKKCSVTLSVPRAIKNEDGTYNNYFEKDIISMKNDNAKALFNVFKGKALQDFGKAGVFVTFGEPFITEEQKKKMASAGREYPTTVYRTALSFSAIPENELSA